MFKYRYIAGPPRPLLATVCSPAIRAALHSANFKFITNCSFIQNETLSRETLVVLCGRRSESRLARSMSASTCSSVVMPANPQSSHAMRVEKETRSRAQQTELSCRAGAALSARESCADSLPAASPPAAPPARSTSLLGSVCRLLLNTQPAPESPKSSSSASSAVCRICFGGESVARLVRPCACRGTVAAVHRACLQRWLRHAASERCELCRYHYRIIRTHKWSWAGSAWRWAAGGAGRALLADAARALALCAVSAAGTARALHACDAVLTAAAHRGGVAALAANVFSSLLIGLIGALNGLLTTWMLLKVQEYQASWRAWRDSTLHVHVVLEGESGSPSISDTPSPPGTPSSPDTMSSPGSVATLVAGDRIDRATNIADPFMVALPFTIPPDL